MYTNTLRANGKSHAVTIPPAALQALRWHKGEMLLLEVLPDDTLVIHSELKLHKYLRQQAENRATQNGAREQTN